MMKITPFITVILTLGLYLPKNQLSDQVILSRYELKNLVNIFIIFEIKFCKIRTRNKSGNGTNYCMRIQTTEIASKSDNPSMKPSTIFMHDKYSMIWFNTTTLIFLWHEFSNRHLVTFNRRKITKNHIVFPYQGIKFIYL